MKRIFELLLIYISLFIAGTLAFICSFHTPLLKNIDVFFYRGLFLILLWGCVFSVVMFGFHKVCADNLVTIRDIILFFIAFCCINVVLFTHLPTTADRSISVFMLGYMAEHPDQSFTEEEMEAIFERKYVEEYGAFKKRFHEQEVTGTISRNGTDGYQITESGKNLIKL